MATPRKYTPKNVGPKMNRQPMVLSCTRCSITTAIFVDPDLPEFWPQHRCRATQRPAPFTEAVADTENRHTVVWKV